MSDLKLADKFWGEVVPGCVGGFEWGAGFEKLRGRVLVQNSLEEVLKGLDEAEFDLFTAQLVIKASGMGIVGTELTEIIGWFREVRG